ncbi:MAG TPA: hypothetical protein VFW14_07865 [Gaiellales bacterium]|nr:hypothetical protein [Gaiellales bacterium]
MVELLLGSGELVLGMAVGALGSRHGGRWFGAAVVLGVAVCAAVIAYAAQTYRCPAGAECDPVTWVDWIWPTLGLVGLWLIAVAMGFAVGDYFRSPLKGQAAGHDSGGL